MKVFKCEISAAYGGGLLIVAANNEEQAFEIAQAAGCHCYKKPIEETNGGHVFHNEGYMKEDFKEVKGLTWDGWPCVIAENSYIE